MGSVMLTSILSVLYVAYSATILIGGWLSDLADVCAWYGSIVASSVWLGFVYIQAGLVAQGFTDKVR
jgi:hypothetical protein